MKTLANTLNTHGCFSFVVADRVDGSTNPACTHIRRPEYVAMVLYGELKTSRHTGVRDMEPDIHLPGHISESYLTRLLVRFAADRLADAAHADVAIAGGGPAGLTLAWLLSEKGYKVTVVEHNLGLGGGMRGGSSLFPALLVEDGISRRLLESIGVRLYPVSETGELFLADPVEVSVKLAWKAVDSGASILVGWHVEDLIYRRTGQSIEVRGLVITLSPVVEAGWHVDPLYVESRATVDATGHDGHLLRIAEKRFPGLIRVPGMSAMNVWEGERLVVERTGEVLPGLFVTGMSVAEAFNTPRMGPVFGGMLASAYKLYKILINKLGDNY